MTLTEMVANVETLINCGLYYDDFCDLVTVTYFCDRNKNRDDTKTTLTTHPGRQCDNVL